MGWLMMGLRYAGQALLMALFGKTVSVIADKTMHEAPDLLGVGRYHVHFKVQTADGEVEKTARFPFIWMAKLYVKLQYKRHVHKKPARVVYKTKHATVTC